MDSSPPRRGSGYPRIALVIALRRVTTRNAIIAISPAKLAAAITLPRFVIARSASRVTSAS